MTILNFVTQEQLDSLDMDDPQSAFMNLVNFAQRSFSAQTSKLDLDERNDYQRREEIRHNFMNVIAASAKRLEIEPFVSMNVPRHSDFNDSKFRNFKDDLDNYVTQIMLDNSMKSKKILSRYYHNLKTKSEATCMVYVSVSKDRTCMVLSAKRFWIS